MNYLTVGIAVFIYLAFAFGFLLISRRMRLSGKVNHVLLLSPILIGFVLGIIALAIMLSKV